jgi:hypothetical protein
MKAKAGKADELMAQERSVAGRKPKGLVAVHIYRLDADSDEFIMAVLFDSKESYVANANSPEQDAEYQKMRALLDADPHWHDGEVVFSLT